MLRRKPDPPDTKMEELQKDNEQRFVRVELWLKALEKELDDHLKEITSIESCKELADSLSLYKDLHWFRNVLIIRMGLNKEVDVQDEVLKEFAEKLDQYRR